MGAMWWQWLVRSDLLRERFYVHLLQRLVLPVSVEDKAFVESMDLMLHEETNLCR